MIGVRGGTETEIDATRAIERDARWQQNGTLALAVSGNTHLWRGSNVTEESLESGWTSPEESGIEVAAEKAVEVLEKRASVSLHLTSPHLTSIRPPQNRQSTPSDSDAAR